MHARIFARTKFSALRHLGELPPFPGLEMDSRTSFWSGRSSQPPPAPSVSGNGFSACLGFGSLFRKLLRMACSKNDNLFSTDTSRKRAELILAFALFFLSKGKCILLARKVNGCSVRAGQGCMAAGPHPGQANEGARRPSAQLPVWVPGRPAAWAGNMSLIFILSPANHRPF